MGVQMVAIIVANRSETIRITARKTAVVAQWAI